MTQENTTVTGEAGNSLLSEEFLKYLPTGNPGLVCVIHADDMKVMFVNEQVEHHLGFNNADLSAGLYLSDLLEDYQNEHLQIQLKGVDNNVAARSAYAIYRVKNKAGKQTPFYLYASPFQAADNPYGKLYFILMLPDASRWGMPFTSFDSKELFLEQFEGEHFGTFEWLIEMHNIYFSAGLQEILEVASGRDINACTARSFIHPDDFRAVEALAKDALLSGKELNAEFRIITAKQNVKTLHCLARLIRHGDMPVKFVGSIRDITHQRSIEQDLKNKVEALYQSNRELEEFAYVASHDLQEPLRKITTFSDRLMDKYKDVLTGDGQLYLSRMTASAENMRRLINDLLEFSRVAKTVQPFESVNLNMVIRQVKMELELVIEETGTTIHAEGLPTIEAIGTQMKQLFGNIINNAIKFRKPDEKPVIDIEVLPLTDKERLRYELLPSVNYYKIQLSDNGIGFEEEYATRIFQVFQRLHGKAEYPGSGIGLAICKKIVEYHHGAIYAESEPGRGARFIIILPEHQQKKQEQ